MALSSYAAPYAPPAVPFTVQPILGVNLTSVFYLTLNTAGLVPPDQAQPPFQLGTTIDGTGDTEWVYCFTGASLAAGAGITTDQYFQATAASSGATATAPSAVTLPSNSPGAFFWAQKAGSGYGQTE